MTKTVPGKTNSAETTTAPVIEAIKGYLEEDSMRFSQLDEDAVELYMQGNNLTMHLIIYLHNNHLIFRVPNFIRNVELRRLDILLFIMQVTNEILDIRFEIGKDGKSLSACCQHILEDGLLTRKQFDLAMMVLVHMVDDTFPRFMQLVYGQAQPPAGQTDAEPVDAVSETEEAEGNDENDEFAPVVDDDEITRKIN
ncbi:MAG: hypothetical protein PHD82_08430 [Candidatus Riflebacteria bacterium]|jgi:hypothetical protein|nr:hypothetical protein [Candidatus Riflebacteria bacterium]